MYIFHPEIFRTQEQIYYYENFRDPLSDAVMDILISDFLRFFNRLEVIYQIREILGKLI